MRSVSVEQLRSTDAWEHLHSPSVRNKSMERIGQEEQPTQGFGAVDGVSCTGGNRTTTANGGESVVQAQSLLSVDSAGGRSVADWESAVEETAVVGEGAADG